MFSNIKKTIIFLLTFFTISASILCLLDYFNIFTRIGLNVKNINLDFFNIVINNGIVITLFLVTFFLFDKKNLEKDKLANYAGVVLLIDTCVGCESFIKILQNIIDSEEEKISSELMDYVYNGPFENDKKIFEFLSNGHILREHFENYTYIKHEYKVLAYMVTNLNENKDFQKNMLENIVELVKKEKEKLENYRENLK